MYRGQSSRLEQLWALQRNQWRRGSRWLNWALDFASEYLIESCSATGFAYLLALGAFGVQAVLVDLFLVKYVSEGTLLILLVEIPLLLHLAWHYKGETAHLYAPQQWLTYSWVHSAKVVVLFCRVMPRLPQSSLTASSASVEAWFFASEATGVFTPNVLYNLLLLTPVFYSLLMYRTSAAIFGGATKTITVDFIMHFDMLWHVAIDMVDQAEMFRYARLAEWLTEDQILLHQNLLVHITSTIPFFLFVSMALQADALPGVSIDRWHIPEAVAYDIGSVGPEKSWFRITKRFTTAVRAKSVALSSAVVKVRTSWQSRRRTRAAKAVVTIQEPVDIVPSREQSSTSAGLGTAQANNNSNGPPTHTTWDHSEGGGGSGGTTSSNHPTGGGAVDVDVDVNVDVDVDVDVNVSSGTLGPTPGAAAGGDLGDWGDAEAIPSEHPPQIPSETHNYTRMRLVDRRDVDMGPLTPQFPSVSSHDATSSRELQAQQGGLGRIHLVPPTLDDFDRHIQPSSSSRSRQGPAASSSSASRGPNQNAAISAQPSEGTTFADRISIRSNIHRPTVSVMSRPMRSIMSKNYTADAAAYALARSRRRHERRRRKRLQDIIQSMHKQNAVLARKRTALASMFFVDIPFLLIRMTLAFLLGQSYLSGMAAKNVICIILNVVQFPLVRYASRSGHWNIERRLAEYAVKCCGATTPDPDTTWRTPSPGLASTTAAAALSRGVSPSEPQVSPLTTPGVVALPKDTRTAAELRDCFLRAAAEVRDKTVRNTSVCVHYWTLAVAFGFGVALAKGEYTVVLMARWTETEA